MSLEYLSLSQVSLEDPVQILKTTSMWGARIYPVMLAGFVITGCDDKPHPDIGSTVEDSSFHFKSPCDTAFSGFCTAWKSGNSISDETSFSLFQMGFGRCDAVGFFKTISNDVLYLHPEHAVLKQYEQLRFASEPQVFLSLRDTLGSVHSVYGAFLFNGRLTYSLARIDSLGSSASREYERVDSLSMYSPHSFNVESFVMGEDGRFIEMSFSWYGKVCSVLL